MWHFAIADRWPGASPLEVLEEWPEWLIEQAMEQLKGEERWRDAHPRGAGR